MKKIIGSVWLIISIGIGLATASPDDVRGVFRGDLVGKYWHQLPSTRYPGFTLPLQWKTKTKYELRHFQPDFGKRIVTVVELPSSGESNDDNAAIVSAVDFSTLKEEEGPEQDCFYVDLPRCDGRLCEGLLIGVINQKVMSKDGTYMPTEVWKITTKNLRFEKVSTKNVACKPRSYAN